MQVGDILMGPNGSPRKVLNLSSGTSKLYDVFPVKGDSFAVTGNHILRLVMSKDKCGNKKNELINISVEDYLRKPPSWQKAVKLVRSDGLRFEEDIQLLINPYYLGLWLGDGHTDDPTRITTADNEILDWLLDFTQTFENSTLKSVGNSDYTYSISGTKQNPNHELWESFGNYSLKGNKHIPLDYLKSNEQSRLSLLAGLLDSDGHLAGNCFDYVTKLEGLSSDVFNLASSLGFRVSVCEKPVWINGSERIYFRLNISGEGLEDIPTILNRKKAKPRKQIKNARRTGFVVLGRQQEDEFFGFEVDQDHLFLLKDFTVTHNSTTCAGLFYHLKMLGYNCEMNREYIKEWLWEDRKVREGDQTYFFSKQARKERNYIGNNLDFIITDSPLVLTHFYGLKYDKMEQRSNTSKVMLQHHHDFCKDKGYKVDHFLIKRAKAYTESGRYQTESDAKQYDIEITQMMNDFGIGYNEVQGDENCVKSIMDLMEVV